jgi:hypothetical protein
MPLVRPSLLTIALFLPACLVEGEPNPSSDDELIDEVPRCIGCNWGPPVTNTHGLNGLSVSALDTTGAMYDGWRLISVEIPADRTTRLIYDVGVMYGLLHGHDANGIGYEGKDFVGSLWTVQLEDTGDTVVMQAVDFEEDQDASRYTFIGGGGPNNDKGYTCAQDPESGEYSVVLFEDLDVDPDAGTHFERSHTIYFGCMSGAVGKAARWGYSPWVTDDETHQTATRTVRADYCGNGTSYTIQGTQLQLNDIFHIHDFADSNKPTEAMWGPEGAYCLDAPRLGYEADSIHCNGEPLPSCKDNGFGNWPDALLWTKIWH